MKQTLQEQAVQYASEYDWDEPGLNVEEACVSAFLAGTEATASTVKEQFYDILKRECTLSNQIIAEIRDYIKEHVEPEQEEDFYEMDVYRLSVQGCHIEIGYAQAEVQEIIVTHKHDTGEYITTEVVWDDESTSELSELPVSEQVCIYGEIF